MGLTIFEGTDHSYNKPGEQERIVETIYDFMENFLHPEIRDYQEAEQKRKERGQYLDKVRGCLFGGAVGDALGYPIEFMKEDAIRNKYGSQGITAYDIDKRTGISDDTQMSLFTATGLLVGDTRGCLRGLQGSPAAYVYNTYMDWLKTQEVPYGTTKTDDYKQHSWLMDVPELYAQRVPGNTCINALKELKYQSYYGFRDIYTKRNDSKGAGGIMRVAPLALSNGGQNKLDSLDSDGAEIAMITHCHSLGYMPAAFLTHVINRIVYPQKDMMLEEIIIEARDTITRIYEDDDNLHTLLKIVNLSLRLSSNDCDDLTNIHQIGEGWVAEETLGIALYCALRYRNDFSKGIIASVNHKGDSDTTGAVAGNILGALNGYDAMEDKWKKDLELADVILEVADDLCYGCLMEEYSTYNDPVWIEKYIKCRIPTEK